ncbi:MAG: hypothetical protein KKF48_03180 [Nanoarchaeota archaeon]|nr:hypothetical protein [Nanoarchaeota archaeon]MBU1028026.1 hypothetical protein [Nanoarchaeota archaeon]
MLNKTYSRPENLEVVLQGSIQEDEKSVKLANRLLVIGWNLLNKKIFEYPTIEEILSLSEKKIKKTKELGKKTLNELKLHIAARGIPLEKNIYSNSEKYFSKHTMIKKEDLLEGLNSFNNFQKYNPFKRAVEEYHERVRRNKSFMEMLEDYESSRNTYLVKKHLRTQIINFTEEGISLKKLSEVYGISYGKTLRIAKEIKEIKGKIKRGRPSCANIDIYDEIASGLLKGLNQSEIAEKRGCHKQAISEFIKNNPELKKLYKETKK